MGINILAESNQQQLTENVHIWDIMSQNIHDNVMQPLPNLNVNTVSTFLLSLVYQLIKICVLVIVTLSQ